MVKTTAVIPNYNGIKFIEKCIDALLLSDTEIKIVVVDNGSTDGSPELIKEKYPEVCVTELGKNTGFCHAMNVGFEKSDTEFVFAINDDACVEPDTVGRLERVLMSDEKIFSVQAKMLKMFEPSVIDSAGDELCALGWAFAYGKDKASEYYGSGIRNVFSACGGAALYRKSILDEIGGFDENHFAYLEDVDLGYRALLNGYTNKIDLDAVVYHAGSATTGSRYNEFKIKNSAKNSVLLIYKNMPIGQIIFNLPFIMIGYLIKLAFFIKKGFGKTYINGLLKGLDMCMLPKVKEKKIYFEKKRLWMYIKIQILLFTNIIRRLG